jgi:hypothetical protein
MNSTAISIRPARIDDCVALWSVAALDSATVPREPLLVAEADGEIVAALSVADGEAIADPFRRTAEAMALLRMRAGQMPSGAAPARRSLLDRVRHRAAPVAAQ